MSATYRNEARTGEFTGWHFLACMLAFFAVIFTVNGIFLYNALKSHPGEYVEKSYLQGLNYNQTLEARAAQSELGWTAQVGIESGDLVARMADANGAALPALEVSVLMRMPANRDNDTDIAMSAAPGGDYVGDIAQVLPGKYTAYITAREPGRDDAVFQAQKTLYVQ